ncbi:MAG: hypothetical protein ACON47_07495 [Flavobacteriaceae bacterium]
MKKLYLSLFFGIWIGCSPPAIPEPDPAVLLAPDNLDSCTTAFSINDTTSQVTFRWRAALYTDSYELVVENSQTGQQYKEQTMLQTTNMVLDKGFPYEWWVLSLSEASLVEARSTSWRFYLESDTIANHIPFATLLLQPSEGAIIPSGEVFFEWKGHDLDAEALRYTFYLGESIDTMQILEADTTATIYQQSLTSPGTYYWAVTTIDSQGNSARSVPFSFQVE